MTSKSRSTSTWSPPATESDQERSGTARALCRHAHGQLLPARVAAPAGRAAPREYASPKCCAHACTTWTTVTGRWRAASTLRSAGVPAPCLTCEHQACLGTCPARRADCAVHARRGGTAGVALTPASSRYYYQTTMSKTSAPTTIKRRPALGVIWSAFSNFTHKTIPIERLTYRDSITGANRVPSPRTPLSGERREMGERQSGVCGTGDLSWAQRVFSRSTAIARMRA